MSIWNAQFIGAAKRWLANKFGELLIWAVLAVGVSLLPIFFVYNQYRLHHPAPVPIEALLFKGELLLVALGLAADSLSRLASRMFAMRQSPGAISLDKLFLALMSGVFVLLASLEYSQLVPLLQDNVPFDASYVISQSKFFFVATLLTGAGVILVD